MSTLLVATGIPFAAAALAGPLVRWLGARAGLIFAIIPLVLLFLILGRPEREAVSWIPSIGLDLNSRLDRLALGFVNPVLLVGCLVFAYSSWYMDGKADLGPYYAGLLAFMGAMLGILLAESRLTQFVFWELTGICSFLLIGTDRESLTAQRAAVNALLVTGLGGLGLLASSFLDPASSVAWGLILLAAATKSAQAPFSGWLPGAMAAPTPISAYLHSATMVQAGVYLVARNAAGAPDWFGPTAIGLGAATALLGAIGSLFANDLKQILAFSTLASLGLFFALAGTPALRGALLSFFYAHAFYKAGLFIIVGVIDKKMGTRDVRQLSGLMGSMPLVGLAALICTLSAVGFPGTVGFVAKESLSLSGGSAVWVALLASSASSMVLLYRFAYRVFLLGKKAKPIALPLSIAMVLAGMAQFSVAFPEPTRRAWNQFIHHPMPLLLSTVVGVLITWLGTKLSLSGLTLPSWPVRYSIAARVSLAGLIARFQDGHLSKYLRVMLISIGVCLGYSLWAMHFHPSTGQLNPEALDWLLAISMISGAVVAVFSGSRLAAVCVLGVVGLALALLFARYSAPDLAMTLIATETLTLIFFVLTLVRFPRLDHRVRKWPRFRDGVVAAVVGGVMATLALTAGLTRQSSEAADFYVQNSLSQGHGRNVVNVILVDFRGFDTLGETTVLAVAGIGIWALLRYRNEAKTAVSEGQS